MLTILMPIYNAMPFLKDAVQSILEQSHDDFKLLALDDGSTDRSVECLHELDDSRIEIVRLPHMGLGAVLQHGLDMCSTEFVARMDADDLSAPSRIRKQIDALRENSELGMVGTQFHYFGESGRRVPSPRLPCGHDEIVSGLVDGALVLVHASLVARTHLMRQAGGYRVRGMGEDWDMFLRMSEVTRLANLPEELYFWRLHAGNTNFSKLLEQQIGIRFALDCARQRSLGLPEKTFGEFSNELKNGARLQRLVRLVDVYSLACYRDALVSIGSGRTARGYAQLFYSAACWPPRTARRLSRDLLGHKW